MHEPSCPLPRSRILTMAKKRGKRCVMFTYNDSAYSVHATSLTNAARQAVTQTKTPHFSYLEVDNIE